MSIVLLVVLVLFLCLLQERHSFYYKKLRQISGKASSLSSLTSSANNVNAVSSLPVLSEIERRRNFAIISHPDAGKTTLTEKLLLFGGAIQDAGAVKAKADQRRATSDWMEIEKQRGISVTSTVLSFEYAPKEGDLKYHLNLLDTPGHQDFSEDTYRTLAAADNCVMLIDGAKGIEDRTRKLYAVCKLRKLPIFTFANKFDRPALSPFDIVDQMEKEFGLECCPMNWPIGHGEDFQGVFDRKDHMVHLFERGNRKKKIVASVLPVQHPDIRDIIGDELYHQLHEDINVLDNLISVPDLMRIQGGEQTPLFFGSAMTNFGVELFLKQFLEFAQKPPGRRAICTKIAGGKTRESPSIDQSVSNISKPDSKAYEPFNSGHLVSEDVSLKSTNGKMIFPGDSEFTAFVFKLQANLDPRHRDRMAFIRICSGVFRKGMKVQHSRLKRSINLASAQNIFAQDREEVVVAFPGDVIGIHNPGVFAIGDTIYTGSESISYPGIPSFSPEKFAYIRNPNPSEYKKFQKGLNELLEEGTVQMLRDRGDTASHHSVGGTPLLAAVGQLQFDVVLYRLKYEYNVDAQLDHLDFSIARWAGGDWGAVDSAESVGKLHGVYICQDRWNRPVLLFRNPWKVEQLTSEEKQLNLEPWAMPPEKSR